jgi:hypothetical protein
MMSVLIDRQAAINVIGKILPADPMHNEYTEGITCGAALAMEFIEQLPSAEPEWIPVTERLPMKTDEYIVCYEDGDVSTAWYGFTDDGLIDGFDEDIIAWMPLPKRYKEADE